MICYLNLGNIKYSESFISERQLLSKQFMMHNLPAGFIKSVYKNESIIVNIIAYCQLLGLVLS